MTMLAPSQNPSFRTDLVNHEVKTNFDLKLVIFGRILIWTCD